MDKAYLEENISAFLDGELSAEEMAQFERELKKYPDLMEMVERMRKLDQLSKSTLVEMPEDKYFDQLARRIEAKLPEKRSAAEDDTPPKRAAVIDLLAANSRTVKIVGSVAAVLLVVLIGVKVFSPTTPRYPHQLRSIEVAPAIERQNAKKSEPAQSVTPEPESEPGRQVQPVPEVEAGAAGKSAIDTTKQKVPEESGATSSDAMKNAEQPKDQSTGLTTKMEPQSVIVQDQAIKPAMLDTSRRMNQMNLVKEAEPLATMSMQELPTSSDRLPADSLRPFAYKDLGYSNNPDPDVFAATVLDSLAARPGIDMEALAAESMGKRAYMNKSGNSTSNTAAGAAAPDTSTINLVAEAEYTYRVAVSNSSNLYDIILAHRLAEQVLKKRIDIATWSKRLMELSRLEQLERNRFQEFKATH